MTHRNAPPESAQPIAKRTFALDPLVVSLDSGAVSPEPGFALLIS
jgi:hypothetical protein